MSDTPASSTSASLSDRPQEVEGAILGEGSTRRELGVTNPVLLSGRLAPIRLGRLGRGLIYGTGLFLFRPLLLLLRRLLGWERRAEISYANGVLVIHRELVVLGASLGREREHLPLARVVSASRLQVTAPEPLALGGLVLAAATVWGLWRVMDGIHGRSVGLVSIGLGAIAAGAAVDIALYWLAGRLSSFTSHGLALNTLDGRRISVLGLPASGVEHLLSTLLEDLHPRQTGQG